MKKNLNDFIQESNNGCVLKIQVKTGSKNFEIQGFDSWTGSLKVKTREKAVNGKANFEIEKELSKIFGTVKIASGFKSKNKKVFVKATKRETAEKLLFSTLIL